MEKEKVGQERSQKSPKLLIPQDLSSVSSQMTKDKVDKCFRLVTSRAPENIS